MNEGPLSPANSSPPDSEEDLLSPDSSSSPGGENEPFSPLTASPPDTAHDHLLHSSSSGTSASSGGSSTRRSCPENLQLEGLPEEVLRYHRSYESIPSNTSPEEGGSVRDIVIDEDEIDFEITDDEGKSEEGSDSPSVLSASNFSISTFRLDQVGLSDEEGDFDEERAQGHVDLLNTRPHVLNDDPGMISDDDNPSINSDPGISSNEEEDEVGGWVETVSTEGEENEEEEEEEDEQGEEEKEENEQEDLIETPSRAEGGTENENLEIGQQGKQETFETSISELRMEANVHVSIGENAPDNEHTPGMETGEDSVNMTNSVFTSIPPDDLHTFNHGATYYETDLDDELGAILQQVNMDSLGSNTNFFMNESPQPSPSQSSDDLHNLEGELSGASLQGLSEGKLESQHWGASIDYNHGNRENGEGNSMMEGELEKLTGNETANNIQLHSNMNHQTAGSAKHVFDGNSMGGMGQQEERSTGGRDSPFPGLDITENMEDFIEDDSANSPIFETLPFTIHEGNMDGSNSINSGTEQSLFTSSDLLSLNQPPHVTEGSDPHVVNYTEIETNFGCTSFDSDDSGDIVTAIYNEASDNSDKSDGFGQARIYTLPNDIVEGSFEDEFLEELSSSAEEEEWGLSPLPEEDEELEEGRDSLQDEKEKKEYENNGIKTAHSIVVNESIGDSEHQQGLSHGEINSEIYPHGDSKAAADLNPVSSANSLGLAETMDAPLSGDSDRIDKLMEALRSEVRTSKVVESVTETTSIVSHQEQNIKSEKVPVKLRRQSAQAWSSSFEFQWESSEESGSEEAPKPEVQTSSTDRDEDDVYVEYRPVYLTQYSTELPAEASKAISDRVRVALDDSDNNSDGNDSDNDGDSDSIDGEATENRLALFGNSLDLSCSRSFVELKSQNSTTYDSDSDLSSDFESDSIESRKSSPSTSSTSCKSAPMVRGPVLTRAQTLTDTRPRVKLHRMETIATSTHREKLSRESSVEVEEVKTDESVRTADDSSNKCEHKERDAEDDDTDITDNWSSSSSDSDTTDSDEMKIDTARYQWTDSVSDKVNKVEVSDSKKITDCGNKESHEAPQKLTDALISPGVSIRDERSDENGDNENSGNENVVWNEPDTHIYERPNLSPEIKSTDDQKHPTESPLQQPLKDLLQDDLVGPVHSPLHNNSNNSYEGQVEVQRSITDSLQEDVGGKYNELDKSASIHQTQDPDLSGGMGDEDWTLEEQMEKENLLQELELSGHDVKVGSELDKDVERELLKLQEEHKMQEEQRLNVNGEQHQHQQRHLVIQHEIISLDLPTEADPVYVERPAGGQERQPNGQDRQANGQDNQPNGQPINSLREQMKIKRLLTRQKGPEHETDRSMFMYYDDMNKKNETQHSGEEIKVDGHEMRQPEQESHNLSLLDIFHNRDNRRYFQNQREEEEESSNGNKKETMSRADIVEVEQTTDGSLDNMLSHIQLKHNYRVPHTTNSPYNLLEITDGNFDSEGKSLEEFSPSSSDSSDEDDDLESMAFRRSDEIAAMFLSNFFRIPKLARIKELSRDNSVERGSENPAEDDPGVVLPEQQPQKQTLKLSSENISEYADSTLRDANSSVETQDDLNKFFGVNSNFMMRSDGPYFIKPSIVIGEREYEKEEEGAEDDEEGEEEEGTEEEEEDSNEEYSEVESEGDIFVSLPRRKAEVTGPKPTISRGVFGRQDTPRPASRSAMRLRSLPQFTDVVEEVDSEIIREVHNPVESYKIRPKSGESEPVAESDSEVRVEPVRSGEDRDSLTDHPLEVSGDISMETEGVRRSRHLETLVRQQIHEPESTSDHSRSDHSRSDGGMRERSGHDELNHDMPASKAYNTERGRDRNDHYGRYSNTKPSSRPYDTSNSPSRSYKDYDRASSPSRSYKDHDRASSPSRSYKDHDRASSPSRSYKDHDRAPSPSRHYKDDRAPRSYDRPSSPSRVYDHSSSPVRPYNGRVSPTRGVDRPPSPVRRPYDRSSSPNRDYQRSVSPSRHHDDRHHDGQHKADHRLTTGENHRSGHQENGDYSNGHDFQPIHHRADSTERMSGPTSQPVTSGRQSTSSEAEMSRYFNNQDSPKRNSGEKGRVESGRRSVDKLSEILRRSNDRLADFDKGLDDRSTPVPNRHENGIENGGKNHDSYRDNSSYSKTPHEMDRYNRHRYTDETDHHHGDTQDVEKRSSGSEGTTVQPALRQPLVTTRTTPLSASRTVSRQPRGSGNKDDGYRVQDLEDTVSSLKRCLKERENEVDGLKSQIMSLQSELHQVKNSDILDKSHFEKKLDNLIAERENLATEVWRLQRELDNRRGDRSPSLTRAGSHPDIPASQGPASLDFDPNNPRALQRKIVELEAQLQDQQEVNESASGKLAHLEKQVIELQEENQMLHHNQEEAGGDLREENALLKEQLESLRTEPMEGDNDYFRWEVRQLREELHLLRDRNHQLTQDNIRLSEHVRDLDDKRSVYKSLPIQSYMRHATLRLEQLPPNGSSKGSNFTKLSENGVMEKVESYRREGDNRREESRYSRSSSPSRHHTNLDLSSPHTPLSRSNRTSEDYRLSENLKEPQTTRFKSELSSQLYTSTHKTQPYGELNGRAQSDASDSTSFLLNGLNTEDKLGKGINNKGSSGLKDINLFRQDMLDDVIDEVSSTAKNGFYTSPLPPPMTSGGHKAHTVNGSRPSSTTDPFKHGLSDLLINKTQTSVDDIDDDEFFLGADKQTYKVSSSVTGQRLTEPIITKTSPTTSSSYTPEERSTSATLSSMKKPDILFPNETSFSNLQPNGLTLKTLQQELDDLSDPEDIDIKKTLRINHSGDSGFPTPRLSERRDSVGSDSTDYILNQAELHLKLSHPGDNVILESDSYSAKNTHIRGGSPNTSSTLLGKAPRLRSLSPNVNSNSRGHSPYHGKSGLPGTGGGLGTYSTPPRSVSATPSYGRTINHLSTDPVLSCPASPHLSTSPLNTYSLAARSVSPHPHGSTHTTAAAFTSHRLESTPGPGIGRPFVPKTAGEINVEDYVKFTRQGGKISKGTIKYIGHLPGKNDTYLGIELEQELGKHDGVYDGIRYFNCKPNRGVFVAFSRVVMAWNGP